MKGEGKKKLIRFEYKGSKESDRIKGNEIGQ